MCYYITMSNLSTDIDNTKKKYREIFLKTHEEFARQIENMPQEELSTFLNDTVPKDIYQKWKKMLEYRDCFKCVGCATCCKLACSEFSYKELKEKASKGDNFATQFTSIFIPYETQDEARQIYPEYFELLAEKLNGENVYFYHCPKLTTDNRCSDYENRPQICRDFPDNPLSLLPKACGYCEWKEEIEPTALMLHGLLEIVDFYKSKMQP